MKLCIRKTQAGEQTVYLLSGLFDSEEVIWSPIRHDASDYCWCQFGTIGYGLERLQEIYPDATIEAVVL